MINYFPEFNSIEFDIGVKNLDLFESKKLYFNPSEVSKHLYAYDRERLKPITEDFNKIIYIDIENGYDSKYMSYKLLLEFLLYFNIPSDKIPYIAKDASGKSFVDVEKIKST
jgi:hypothetical protein